MPLSSRLLSPSICLIATSILATGSRPPIAGERNPYAQARCTGQVLGPCLLQSRHRSSSLDPVKAAAYIREALNLAKDSAEFNQGLSEALLASGALDQADAYAKSAEAEIGNDKDLSAAIALTRAKILRRRGQLEPAMAAYDRALHLGVESPSILWEAYAELGALYAASNEVASANAYYEKALEVIAVNRADQLKSDYKITFLSNLITFYQDYVALLMKENQPARALEIADSSRASVLREGLSGESQSRDVHLLDEVRKTAKASNSVFLFYWLAPKTSYLWAIGGGRTIVKELPDQQQIRLYVDLTVE